MSSPETFQRGRVCMALSLDFGATHTLQLLKCPVNIFIASTTIMPAMVAFVVAMAWMMLPAMPCSPHSAQSQRETQTLTSPHCCAMRFQCSLCLSCWKTIQAVERALLENPKICILNHENACVKGYLGIKQALRRDSIAKGT